MAEVTVWRGRWGLTIEAASPAQFAARFMVRVASQAPARPLALLKHEDGCVTVRDLASGRSLTFAPSAAIEGCVVEGLLGDVNAGMFAALRGGGR